MKKGLIIVGTGDYSEMALQYIQRDCTVEIAAFSVERDYIKNNRFCGLPVVAFEELESNYSPSDYTVLVAVGPNKVNTVRQRLFEEALAKGYAPFTYVSKKASVWNVDQVGAGSFIFDQCVVEPGAQIGRNTVMWSGAIVAHHSVIGDHCFLAPGCAVSGRIKVGNNCFLGINSTIRDNVEVAERCIIGGGAVIKKNTLKDGVYSAPGTTLRNQSSLNTKV